MIEIKNIDKESLTIKPDGLLSKSVRLSLNDLEQIRRGYMYIFATQQVLAELHARIEKGQLADTVLEDSAYVDTLIDHYFRQVVELNVSPTLNDKMLTRAFNTIHN